MDSAGLGFLSYHKKVILLGVLFPYQNTIFTEIKWKFTVFS
jgi:hypothetical protein